MYLPPDCLLLTFMGIMDDSHVVSANVVVVKSMLKNTERKTVIDLKKAALYEAGLFMCYNFFNVVLNIHSNFVHF